MLRYLNQGTRIQQAIYSPSHFLTFAGTQLHFCRHSCTFAGIAALLQAQLHVEVYIHTHNKWRINCRVRCRNLQLVAFSLLVIADSRVLCVVMRRQASSSSFVIADGRVRMFVKFAVSCVYCCLRIAALLLFLWINYEVRIAALCHIHCNFSLLRIAAFVVVFMVVVQSCGQYLVIADSRVRMVVCTSLLCIADEKSQLYVLGCHALLEHL